MKKTVLAIVGIIVALLILSALALIVVQTKGLTTSFKTFYVNVNGERVLENASGYVIDNSHPLDVGVKYVFGKLFKDATGYSLKVVPADDVDFVFTIDGAETNFADEIDLIAGFDVELQKDDFVIKPKGCLRQILSKVHDGANIVVPEEFEKTEDNIFKLIVTSSDGKQDVEIIFGIKYLVVVEGVTMSDTDIVL